MASILYRPQCVKQRWCKKQKQVRDYLVHPFARISEGLQWKYWSKFDMKFQDQETASLKMIKETPDVEGNGWYWNKLDTTRRPMITHTSDSHQNPSQNKAKSKL